MAIHFSKRIVIFVAAAIIGGFGSFQVGYAGVNPVQMINESRCRAGAFLGRTNAPGALVADAPSAANSSQATDSESDTALTIQQPVTTSGPNLIPNPGVETLSAGNPTSWYNNHTGNNNARFTQVLGHDSGRALRIDITDFKDGTADWFTGLTSVQPNGYYQFSDYYRSNVTTHVTLQFKDDQGNQRYYSLGTIPSSTNWTQYTVRFAVPGNVHQAMVSHTLDRAGALETDDYSLQAATPSAQFKQPLVSITFDDGWESAHANALPIMKQYGVVSTQYIVTGILGTKGYETASDIYDFRNAGHEIASHTLTHPDLTKQNDKQLGTELTIPHNAISKCYNPATDFAAPYGTYNVRTTTAIKGLYQTARSTDTGLNTADHFNPYELKVVNMSVNTTPQQLQGWLDAAKANHAWLILVYHQVDTSGSPFSRNNVDFAHDMQKVVASGISVKTVHDAYAELQPQLKH
ncbi:MAG TPA: polysaccharide deacetylase family protein [Candidatus Saccharimonadia bacterium]|jgi:peptidoglycan/xylan/chitin deacetylase (PgdA/CDA1 family)